MIHSDSLPLLPGFSFNKKIGCENWHKSSQLAWLNGKVPYLVEPKRPPIASGYPFPWDPSNNLYASLYPMKEHGELPAWIVYDKQILSFDAYFYGNSFKDNTNSEIRKVKINFFLEDGTLQVNEKKKRNNGSLQETLISRRRVPFIKPMEKVFYEVIDLNIGKSVELYSRTYFINDCDKFTRQWLNRVGIPVPEPMEIPGEDNLKQKRQDAQRMAKNVVPKNPDKLGKFLKFDGHVLRLYGYWDDRESQGQLHKLILQYYLADDTIDVREKGGAMLLARSRLPKMSGKSLQPGTQDSHSLLNVIATGYLKGRVAKDPQNVGALQGDYYTDADLLPGVCVNVYGRAVQITSCDPFTQDFYRSKYGLEHFEELSSPPSDEDNCQRKEKKIKAINLPPWNGFGSFEDSAGNCTSLVPKPSHGKSIKTLVKARSGLDSNILRFRGRMMSDEPTNQQRNFVVSYYLADDTISIFETATINSGFQQGMFLGRKEAFKPVENKNVFVSRKPSTYSKEDMWVGNELHIDGYEFELTEADEYCLSYMELNSQEFPKSNIELILSKIRNKLRPIYKTFVRDHLLPNGQQIISQENLEAALSSLVGTDITKHEIITVCRHFSVPQCRKKYDKDTLRVICRNECHRLLFLGFDRLSENLRQRDYTGTNHIARSLAYSICRGAKVPVVRDLLNTVLDSVEKNSNQEVNITDLLSFFDLQQDIRATSIPFNHVREFSDFVKNRATSLHSAYIDCTRFTASLALEDELKKE